MGDSSYLLPVVFKLYCIPVKWNGGLEQRKLQDLKMENWSLVIFLLVKHLKKFTTLCINFTFTLTTFPFSRCYVEVQLCFITCA